MINYIYLKSPNKLYNGYLNVAGLFFSKKKCPIQAQPYPTIGRNFKKWIVYVNMLYINNKITVEVPTQWSLLFI